MPWNALTRSATAAALAAAVTGSAALGDVGSLAGSWVPTPSSRLGDTGIAQVVVVPAGPDHVQIHLYGRCGPGLCDWGQQFGRNHSDAPGSDELRSVTADFNIGTAVLHITLRPGPGGVVLIDTTTDFTDRSGRNDFEASGSLAPSARTAAAAPPVFRGAAPAAQLRVAEDCHRINPADVYVAPVGRGWKIQDFDHVILDFGVNKLAAMKTERVLKFYGFDEQCYIAKPRPKMIYWRTAGQFPRSPMPGQDCVEVHWPRVGSSGGKVFDDRLILVDYGDDVRSAQQAASVIRAYRLARECFVARPDLTMVYWLTQ